MSDVFHGVIFDHGDLRVYKLYYGIKKPCTLVSPSCFAHELRLEVPILGEWRHVSMCFFMADSIILFKIFRDAHP